MEATQSIEDEFPVFDGTGSGYGWSISAWQFWNRRGTPEAQRLAEVSRTFSGRSLIWFQLWSLQNPNADWDTFDLAFLYQFQPHMRPILPEICWKEVENREIEWVEMRAKLLQQPQIDPETIKFQTEQEIITISIELQEEKEVEENPDLDATSNSATNSITVNKFNFTVHKSTNPEYEIDEDAKLDQNLDLQLEQSNLEAMDSAVEENALIGAEVYVTEKEKHPDQVVTNIGAGIQSSKRGTSDSSNTVETEKRRTAMLENGEASMLGGGPRAQAVRRAMLLNPPPLMAAVFPWDRGKGSTTAPDPTGKVEDVDDNDSSNAEVFVSRRRGYAKNDGRGDFKLRRHERHDRERDKVVSGGSGAWRMVEDDFPDLTRWRNPSRTTSHALLGAEQQWMAS